MGWFWPPKVPVSPPDLGPSAPGGPCGQPASQPAPANPSQPPASPLSSQPFAIQCPRNPLQGSSELPKSPCSLPKPSKTNGFQRVLLYQPGSLQHQLWMPKAPKLPPSDPQRASRNSQVHPKCSLETPKMTPNTPIWNHLAQSEPNLSPEGPKIHQKTPKMLPK